MFTSPSRPPLKPFHFRQKSSLTENWPSSCSRGSTSSESALRYIVYKQPLSLDRFFIHDVTPHESAASKLEAAFVLVNLNRFQQIIAVYTFQAQTEQIKVSSLCVKLPSYFVTFYVTSTYLRHVPCYFIFMKEISLIAKSVFCT